MRQLIIARKDLNMSPGKLAAQCCHASLAFLTYPLKTQREQAKLDVNGVVYNYPVRISRDIYEDWICEAKNRNQLIKAADIAKANGLHENRDYFLIKDCCLTELVPEEVDENGVGKTLTCIGFRPLPDDVAHAISKKYQLYK